MRAKAIAVSLVLSGTAFANGYEMKDLEALEKQESWQEVVQHLGDIPPSKRNDAWNRIAEKAGAGVLAAVDPKKDGDRGRWGPLAPPHALEIADGLIKQYPTLKKSKVFMQARADAALKGFAYTYSNSSHNANDDPWREQLKTFVESDTLTPDLALRTGKLVTSRLVAYIAVPFFKKAIETNAAACKDGDVKKSLVSAILDNVWQEDAKALLDKSCWNEARPVFETELANAKIGDDAKKNGCTFLAAKKVTPAACK